MPPSDRTGPASTADRSGGRRLTTSEAYGPSYAGDGRIAYERFDGIYVMNGDGSGQHTILANETQNSIDPPQRIYTKNEEPAFSPGGQTIAFTRTVNTTTYLCNPFPNCTGSDLTREVDVYLMNADGTNLRRLTSTPAVDEVDPSISPDGTKVVYFHWPEKDQAGNDPPEDTGELWIVGTDGQGAHRLVGGSNPEWSNVRYGPGRPRLKVSGVPRGCARGPHPEGRRQVRAGQVHADDPLPPLLRVPLPLGSRGCPRATRSTERRAGSGPRWSARRSPRSRRLTGASSATAGRSG